MKKIKFMLGILSVFCFCACGNTENSEVILNSTVEIMDETKIVNTKSPESTTNESSVETQSSQTTQLKIQTKEDLKNVLSPVMLDLQISSLGLPVGKDYVEIQVIDEEKKESVQKYLDTNDYDSSLYVIIVSDDLPTPN